MKVCNTLRKGRQADEHRKQGERVREDANKMGFFVSPEHHTHKN